MKTEIDHPAQFQAGIGYTGITNTTITVDYAWIDYKVLQHARCRFHRTSASQLSTTLIENYKSSNSVRFGVEHAFAAGFRGRVGFDWVGSPAPDETVTPLLPDMDRRNYTIGIGLPIGASYTLDAGFLHVDTGGRRGSHRRAHRGLAGGERDGRCSSTADSTRSMRTSCRSASRSISNSTGRSQMYRNRYLAGGVAALTLSIALVACSDNNDVLGGKPVDPLFKTLRLDGQQHHGRLSVGRHQRLDADAELRRVVRACREHGLSHSAVEQAGVPATGRQFPHAASRRRRHGCHMRAAQSCRDARLHSTTSRSRARRRCRQPAPFRVRTRSSRMRSRRSFSAARRRCSARPRRSRLSSARGSATTTCSTRRSREFFRRHRASRTA